jgi:hypothetical protein
LVVSGLYRHVRNPMYLAVLTVVFGQALLLGSTGLLARRSFSPHSTSSSSATRSRRCTGDSGPSTSNTAGE